MKRIFPCLLSLILLLCACGQGGGPQPGPDGLQPEPGVSAPTWQEQYDLGVRYLSEGNYQEAIIAFTAAIQIDPKRAEAYVGRGGAYVLSGETESNLTAALSDYEAAIGLDGTGAEAYLGLADVYIRRGEYDKALDVLRQGLEKTGENQAIADKIAEIEQGSISDSSGNIRRITGYDRDGNLDYWHDYTYDELGRWSAVTAGGSHSGHIDILYDERGNQLTNYGSTNDGELVLIRCEYDSSGILIKEIFYDPGGQPSNYLTYEYNESGRLTFMRVYLADGTLEYVHQYEYNSDGKESRDLLYNADGSLVQYYLHEYNGNGNLTNRSLYSANGELIFMDVFIYDEEGTMIRIDSYDDSGDLMSSMTYN